MINDAKALDGKIFVTNKGLTGYFEDASTIYERLLEDYNKEITQNSSTILFLDHARDVDLKDISLENCNLIKKYSNIGKLFFCSKKDEIPIKINKCGIIRKEI
jgi:hypothetical protein